MNIYIDESGSFAYASEPNAWCAVGSYVIPESDEEGAVEILTRLKKSVGTEGGEIKIHNLDEDQFTAFLSELKTLEAAFHAVTTDSSLNSPDKVKAHQQKQGLLIVEHLDKMKYEEGRQALRSLREKVESLSEQLYVQLYCQLILMFKTVQTMIPYYIQRIPESLSRFCWRVDQKNITRTRFEEAFEILGPPIFQTLSFSDPIMMIKELDYSVMQEFLYTKDTAPKYLKETYGIDIGEGGINIQKLIRADIDFVDSATSTGIQIADLLVSGLRKCLRLQWHENEKIAYGIGRLMVQAKQRRAPLELMSLSGRSSSVGKKITLLVKIMRGAARPFVHHSLISKAHGK